MAGASGPITTPLMTDFKKRIVGAKKSVQYENRNNSFISPA